ncbi:MAG: ribulose-phosphate 3-epimerase [Bacteroidales bacterium]|nr:ribulose-phosphate 3-epimerase [Bacteroidales bacterium]
MKPLLSPSILAADLSQLTNVIALLNESEADFIHMDIMDGVFVPNITFGFPVLETVAAMTEKPLDVHLMIVQPERYISQFKAAGAGMLTVHYEAVTHLHRVVHQIKHEDMLAGVALNPATPVSMLEDIIADLDLVLLMSVNPGFAGQKFISNAYSRLQSLRELVTRKNTNTLIEIDGGIDMDNAFAVVKAGADILVAGNAVFNHPSPLERISLLKNDISVI